MSRLFHAIPALEQRTLLSGSVSISVYGDMGVHTAAVPLPSGSQGFVGFTAHPMSGTAVFDLNSSVQYTYNASGSTTNDSFTFSYLDGLGQTDSYTVNVTIIGDTPPTSGSGIGSGSGSAGSSESSSGSGYGSGSADGDGSGSESESGSGGGTGTGTGTGTGSGPAPDAINDESGAYHGHTASGSVLGGVCASGK